MNETNKMNLIRKENGYDNYFCGHGIDLGCGNDILNANYFNRIISIQPYDVEHGDANHCANIQDNNYDFVYSSHLLEHMRDPALALKNWIRICKSGGYVIAAVPHEIYYEKMIWPSRYNHDHKYSFRLERTTVMPKSIYVPEFLSTFNAKVVSCELYLLNFDFTKFWEDQTLQDAVCQIEFILQKY